MNSLTRRSPLANLRAGRQLAEICCDDLLLREQPRSGKILLCVRGNVQTIIANLSQAVGLNLPLAPNTVSGDDPRAIWLGPRKWLLVCEGAKVEMLRRKIRQALTNTVSIVSECSDARIAIRISGTNARALIAKACALDLREDHFAPGHCAQTLFARIPMLVHQLDAAPSFDLYFDTSLSVYAWRWMRDASIEFLSRPSNSTKLRARR